VAPDPYCFKVVMYLKRYGTLRNLNLIFLVSGSAGAKQQAYRTLLHFPLQLILLCLLE
jgi:hypothetical protein